VQARYVVPLPPGLHVLRDDLVQGQVGGVDQPGTLRAVRQQLLRDEAAGVQADLAPLDEALAADRDQVGGARPRTDEVDPHAFT